MDLNYKKKFIFDKINEIEKHNKIVNFIMFHEIKHTVNNNGYFINISKLSDELIDKLYNLVIDLNDNITDNIDQEIKEIIKTNENSKNTINKIVTVKDIKLNEFSQNDKILINKSKTYKFE